MTWERRLAVAVGTIGVCCAGASIAAFCGYGISASHGVVARSHQALVIAGQLHAAQCYLALSAVGVSSLACLTRSWSELAARLGWSGLRLGILAVLLTLVMV